MTVRASVVDTDTVAVLVASAGSSLSDKKTVAITGATGAIFLGGPDVDTTDGFPIDANTDLVLELGPGDALWAVSATALALNVLITRAD